MLGLQHYMLSFKCKFSVERLVRESCDSSKDYKNVILGHLESVNN